MRVPPHLIESEKKVEPGEVVLRNNIFTVQEAEVKGMHGLKRRFHEDEGQLI
jgi:hypothetical protein